MRNINLKITNKKKLTFLLIGLGSLFLISIVIPSFFIHYLEFSGIGHFFSDYIKYSLISLIILLYFMLVGEYYYKIKIDPYIIQVISYRPIISFFTQKDYVDIPHSMLAEYSFFNRSLSLNKTLMLKIETDSGKKIAKRFTLTLISENEIKKISNALDKIIAKNN